MSRWMMGSRSTTFRTQESAELVRNLDAVAAYLPHILRKYRQTVRFSIGYEQRVDKPQGLRVTPAAECIEQEIFVADNYTRPPKNCREDISDLGTGMLLEDETAISDRYGEQDPAVVRSELADAARTISDSFAAVTPDQLGRTGIRSDGARFTVDSFARYFIHDPVHHIWDVAAGSPA